MVYFGKRQYTVNQVQTMMTICLTSELKADSVCLESLLYCYLEYFDS